MIGLSMALTIAVCVGGFSVLYAALDNTFADFIAHEVPTAVIPTLTATEAQVAQQPSNDPTQPPNAEAPTATTASSTDNQASSTPASGDFEPDYQTTSSAELNFRSEPSTEGGASTVIVLLDFSTPLMFLDQTSPATTSEDGEEGWMQFRLEDGTEGWLRAIDVEPYSP